MCKVPEHFRAAVVVTSVIHTGIQYVLLVLPLYLP